MENERGLCFKRVEDIDHSVLRKVVDVRFTLFKCFACTKELCGSIDSNRRQFEDSVADGSHWFGFFIEFGDNNKRLAFCVECASKMKEDTKKAMRRLFTDHLIITTSKADRDILEIYREFVDFDRLHDTGLFSSGTAEYAFIRENVTLSIVKPAR